MDKKQYWIDVLKRAAWTFLEVFVATLCTLTDSGADNIAWRVVLATAIGAGVSAIKTIAVNSITVYKQKYVEKAENSEEE